MFAFEAANVVICFVIWLQFTFSIHVSLFCLCLHSNNYAIERSRHLTESVSLPHLMSFISLYRCHFVGCWLNFHCFWPYHEKCIDNHDDKTIAFYLKLRRHFSMARNKKARSFSSYNSNSSSSSSKSSINDMALGKTKQMRFWLVGFSLLSIYNAWKCLKNRFTKRRFMWQKTEASLHKNHKIWRHSSMRRMKRTSHKIYRKAINSHWPFFLFWHTMICMHFN